MGHCEVSILGPSSSFKTRTGRDIRNGLEDACLFSLGSVFRSSAEVLGEYGIPPHSVNSPLMEQVLSQIDYEVVNGVVTFQRRNGIEIKHSAQNGTMATNYAENPIFQNTLLQYIKDQTQEIHKNYSTIIFEGRRSLKDGLNIFLTAPTGVRTEIKKIECDVAGLSDEEIARGIVTRDIKDAGKKSEPLKRPLTGVVIRRESVSEDEHKAIVNFSLDTIRHFQETGNGLPRQQVVYMYDSGKGALVERMPSYR